MPIKMNEINQNQVNFYNVTEADDQQRLDNMLIKIPSRCSQKPYLSNYPSRRSPYKQEAL